MASSQPGWCWCHGVCCSGAIERSRLSPKCGWVAYQGGCINTMVQVTYLALTQISYVAISVPANNNAIELPVIMSSRVCSNLSSICHDLMPPHAPHVGYTRHPWSHAPAPPQLSTACSPCIPHLHSPRHQPAQQHAQLRALSPARTRRCAQRSSSNH
jgi:hypothetical protein